ncbi:hypothetical protein OROGR_012219 [Orobanche gracilis]
MEVQYSQLAGKKVIIIFEWFYSRQWEALFVETLKERYMKLKGTGDEFEVIHIVQESYHYETKKQHHIVNLPWFVQPAAGAANKGYECKVFNFYKKYGFYNGGRSIVAFDRDGTIVRRTIYPTVEDLKFPFYASGGGLKQEASSQLVGGLGEFELLYVVLAGSGEAVPGLAQEVTSYDTNQEL